MEKQILKTVVTVEFAADETSIAANALSLIAAARNGMPLDERRAKTQPDQDDEPEPEKPTRTRRSRKSVDEDEKPKRNRKDVEPDDDPVENDDARPEPATKSKRQNDVTHDDIRDLMAEVIGDDEDNRPKVLKQLNKIGARSVGTIKDEDVSDFFSFLQSLKSA